ncbi:MAG: phenylalanine--tRNA ligase subunit alpha [Microbacteriaceae bacterium]|jgi:phenylalanyl-tRNA synthetase alpha chain|nr:phenylalanine--tRNA ligase subunit alpha [Microbacteriaceae bacterium]MDR9443714.1 phenylalanine--tRNA ligase subunit alpha [Microbacteriaceae bacterium]
MSEITPDKIAQVIAEADELLASAQDIEQLKALRSKIIGDDSEISKLNATIKSLPNDQKASAGKLIGEAKGKISANYAEKEQKLLAEHKKLQLQKEADDLSAYANMKPQGARHPLSLMMEQVSDAFVGMGWEIAEGPELESEWFNFDALNFDQDHPARAMQDTFFVSPLDAKLVLRTHTSPVQVRSMLERDIPIYVLCPGRVFRTDELDATHTPVFHQVEGLAIDKGLTMADLKGTLEHFARKMFGEEAEIRLRPSYFPFTEPSAELDVWHPQAKGGPRWVEWGGCGMVNPNVLKASGIDPEVYSGFAFGMGIERTLMFRNGVLDMHDMVEGDMRFARQFGVRI